MPFDNMNMFQNGQVMPQPNQVFQLPTAPGQFGMGNYPRMLEQRLQRFPPIMGGQGGPGGGMPGAQGIPGNSDWGAWPQNAGGQGYATPSYPPQSFGQQQPQWPMPPAQSYPSQGFSPQGYPLQVYAPQRYNQGYGGQMPVQPTWEEPKKGGIKGFIGNIMAKLKR